MPSPDGADPRVAILLLNWNGREDTLECLESLFRLDYAPATVVLCDNASSDGSVEAVRAWAAGEAVELPATPAALRHLVDPRVRKPIEIFEISRAEAEGQPTIPADARLVIINNGVNLGFAGGNNVGLRFVLTQPALRYVWILNNDILVAPDSLRALVQRAQEVPTAGGVGGVLYEYHEPGQIQSSAGGQFPAWKGLSIPVRHVHYRRTQGGLVAKLDYLSAGCMLVSREMLGRVGLIDEGYFMYGEDVDYSFRMRRAGFALEFAPGAKVWHKGGGAVPHRSARHDYYIVRNSLHIVRKYFPRMLPLASLYVAYRCVLPKIIRGQWTRLEVLRRAYRDFREGRFGAAADLPGERTRGAV